MSFLDVPFILLIFYSGHLIVNRVVKGYDAGSDRPMLLRLLYYHLFFSLVYGWYVITFGGDAVGYWRNPIRGGDWLSLHQTGTNFIRFLTFPFSKVLGLSYWTGTLLFSLFGFSGFIFIYLTFRKFTRVNPMLFGFRLFPLILFLPNMHFWSAGIGKDSVIFFALTLFIFSMTNPTRNFLGIVVSFYLAYFIRPHMALLMLVGMAFSMLVSNKGVSFFWRILFLGGSVYVFVLIAPAVFEFIGLDEETIEGIGDISTRRSTNVVWHSVGSAIDIRSYTVPLKIFTFLFRPLFVDANNFFGLIVSVENLFYVLLGLYVLRFRNLMEILRMPMHLKAGLFVLASTSFFMSSSLGNLGIIIRQKNMVMFMFLMITVYLISKAQEVKLTRRPMMPSRAHAKTEAA
ncbi:MAG: hypothetical protein JNK10_00045 [Cyclobacteriaceae bacterium]|nr:hypothetical protein [Cyclobacteriaceae bacterium]